MASNGGDAPLDYASALLSCNLLPCCRTAGQRPEGKVCTLCASCHPCVPCGLDHDYQADNSLTKAKEEREIRKRARLYLATLDIVSQFRYTGKLRGVSSSSLKRMNANAPRNGEIGGMNLRAFGILEKLASSSIRNPAFLEIHALILALYSLKKLFLPALSSICNEGLKSARRSLDIFGDVSFLTLRQNS